MNYVYELKFAQLKHNFEIANDDAEIVVKGMEVVSDKSKSNYQMKSAVIDVLKGKTYQVTFDIELVQGDMALGVLDVDRQVWIKQVSLTNEIFNEQTFEFIAPGKQCQLILQTDNAVRAVSIPPT